MVWLTLAPLAVFYITSMAFIINNEIFQGMQAITLQPIED